MICVADGVATVPSTSSSRRIRSRSCSEKTLVESWTACISGTVKDRLLIVARNATRPMTQVKCRGPSPGQTCSRSVGHDLI